MSNAIAVVLGLMMVYVAWQQWRTNHHRLKLELYDRRLKVYEGLIEFLKHITSEKIVTEQLMSQYITAVASSEFLFNDDIIELLGEVGHKAYSVLNSSIKENEDLKSWYEKQIRNAKILFRSSLDFRKL